MIYFLSGLVLACIGMTGYTAAVVGKLIGDMALVQEQLQDDAEYRLNAARARHPLGYCEAALRLGWGQEDLHGEDGR